MRLSQKQLRTLINEAMDDLGPGRPYEPEPVDGASDDDAENATNALYALDMLHVFFNSPELNRARTLVMQRLSDIADAE